jgi:hypothetical protein
VEEYESVREREKNKVNALESVWKSVSDREEREREIVRDGESERE